MRIRNLTIVMILVALLSPAWAQEMDESKAIEVLGSNAPVAEKDAACKRLKGIGSPASVPALAACLTDDTLSLPARLALQAMPFAQVDKALLAALPEATGANRLGIIDSLGVRRSAKAVSALRDIMQGSDGVAAIASARSLGRIATKKARVALEKGLSKSGGRVDVAIMDGLLRVSEHAHEDGQDELSGKLARKLCEAKPDAMCPLRFARPYRTKVPDHIRAAAYRAWILAGGEEAPNRLEIALGKNDKFAQQAALGLASELPGEAVAGVLVAAFEKLSPENQVALLSAFARRGDVVARDVVVKAADGVDTKVRLAALGALGHVGDDTTVPMLAERSVYGPAMEQKAARQALSMLRHGDVHKAILALVAKSDAEMQTELVKILAIRKDKGAVEMLFALAEGQDEKVKTTAVNALGVLADTSHTTRLLALLAAAKSDALREAVENTLVAVASNSDKPEDIVAALLAMDAALPVNVRVSALRTAARIDSSLSLSALRNAIVGSETDLRVGAIRSLSEYGNLEVMSDLLSLAGKACDDVEHAIALRGYWRLAALTTDKPAADRLALVRAGFAKARTDDDKKAGLAVLSGIASKDALGDAEKFYKSEAVRSEAETAAYQIATRIFIVERPTAEGVLANLAKNGKEERLRTDAAGFAAQLAEGSSYIVPWLVSQPYRVEGKGAGELFDMPLGPEMPDGGGVKWSKMPIPADPLKFWMVDLLSVAGGDNCILYLKSEVFWPEDGEVNLEMGSDDGLKVWVNGALVHSNNAVRGFAPGQDKASATLKKGWNSFMVKVSQHSAGCALAIRIQGDATTAQPPLQVEAR